MCAFFFKTLHLLWKADVRFLGFIESRLNFNFPAFPTYLYLDSAILTPSWFPHQGWFEFRICDVATTGGVEATQECLDQNILANSTGHTRFEVPAERLGYYDYSLVLPSGLVCSHCMIQWKWHCGKKLPRSILFTLRQVHAKCDTKSRRNRFIITRKYMYRMRSTHMHPLAIDFEYPAIA